MAVYNKGHILYIVVHGKEPLTHFKLNWNGENTVQFEIYSHYTFPT
jgi:hypothetical protein